MLRNLRGLALKGPITQHSNYSRATDMYTSLHVHVHCNDEEVCKCIHVHFPPYVYIYTVTMKRFAGIYSDLQDGFPVEIGNKQLVESAM